MRRGVGDRLNARFLIVGGDRDVGIGFDPGLIVHTQHRDFLISPQDLRHLSSKSASRFSR
jgi:hypothetical protein